MKHSTLIKRAKKYIKPDELKGVCSALEQVIEDSPNCSFDSKEWHTVDEVQTHIHDLLGKFAFAHDWLVNELKISPKQEEQMEWLQDNTEAIQKWRLKWMDQLALEYKAKGM